MIELKGYIDIPSNILGDVILALQKHTKLTEEEPGCILFLVTQDADLETRFHVHEQFVDQQAFEFHQSRVQSSVWGELTKTAKRSYQITSR